MVKGLLIDISGVLYRGDEALPGAVAALDRLQREQIPHLLVTNTSTRTRHQVAQKLKDLGFYLEEKRILSTVDATAEYLREHRLKPLLIINPAIRGAFADLVDPVPNAVVLGDAGDLFDYNRLNRAFHLLMDGAPLIAMGANRYYRNGDGDLCLDIGPFKAALEFAAECTATVIGKPAAHFFHSACRRLALTPGEVGMIGDDAEMDVAAASAAGLRACLVKTGKYQPGDEQLCPDAAVVADLTAAIATLLD